MLFINVSSLFNVYTSVLQHDVRFEQLSPYVPFGLLFPSVGNAQLIQDLLELFALALVVATQLVQLAIDIDAIMGACWCMVVGNEFSYRKYILVKIHRTHIMQILTVLVFLDKRPNNNISHIRWCRSVLPFGITARRSTSGVTLDA